MSSPTNKQIEIFKNKSLKDFCTIKIGGKADYVFVCFSIPAIKSAIRFCKTKSIKYKIIGLGANLIFDDCGYKGAIIVNRCEKIIKSNSTLLCESGTNLANLISYTKLHNLSGLEKFSAIPCTLGGAVCNNIGGKDFDFAPLVICVYGFYSNNLNHEIKLSTLQCQFGYHTSIFCNNNFIITKVKLQLSPANFKDIQLAIYTALTHKLKTQPMDKFSAGSVFKFQPFGVSKFIDTIGLKGCFVGGASISTKHAGFIVNNGTATCKDVKTLVKNIQIIAHNTIKKDLPTEIEFVDT